MAGGWDAWLCSSLQTSLPQQTALKHWDRANQSNIKILSIPVNHSIETVFFLLCQRIHLPKVMTLTKRHERGKRTVLEEKDETCSFDGASSEIIININKQIALYSLNRHHDLEIISFVQI